MTDGGLGAREARSRQRAGAAQSLRSALAQCFRRASRYQGVFRDTLGGNRARTGVHDHLHSSGMRGRRRNAVRTTRPPSYMPTTRPRRRPHPPRTWADVAAPRLVGGTLHASCVECGERFEARRRDAAFCSRVCQSRAWRRHRNARRCESCRHRLPTRMRATARFCSDACRQRAARARAARARAESIGEAA